MNTKLLAAATALVAATLPTTAIASPVHGDLEIDPTAYALSGNSLHVGIGLGHLRVDLGCFAMALPQFVHGDDGFDVSFDGFGAKLQWFPRAEQTGFFAGVDGGVLRVLAERRGTDLAARDVVFGVGVHAGYRITLPASFYVTPWIGVGYNVGTDAIILDGKTYAPSAFTVFPAVHLGYRFE